MTGSKQFLVLVTVAVLAVVTGCGHKKSGSDSSAATVLPTGVRLANAIPTASATLNAAGITDTTAVLNTSPVSAGGVNAYALLAPQTYTVGVGTTDGSLIASTKTLGLTTNTNYTVLAYPRDGAVNTFTLLDNHVAPAVGFASLAIANAASDAGQLDVYLVAPNTPLNGVAPVFPNVVSLSVSSALSITEGTYDVVVTASGKPADVRATLPSIALVSGDITTIALTSTTGGSLVDASIIQQGGSMVVLPSTKARVRVAGAFPPNGSVNSSVAATVNGSALPTITAPSVGSYTLVNGGSSSYNLKVDGVDVAGLPAITFANGGDYTILVYGSAATPTVNVFTDNNQPSSNGSANLRLINAAVTGGGITLDDNYLPINSDVTYGTASVYSPATVSPLSYLQITSPVAAFPTYTASNVSILGSSIYTVFVLGSTTTPVVVFNKDR
jgi:Domain of unknown function (DUF4397)